MDSEFTRTSVTKDEAVAILLGWVDGPIAFRPLNDDPSQEEQDICDSLMYSLQEDLEEAREKALSDLAEAKYDKLDSIVIEARSEVVQKTDANIAWAKTYLSAIEDELNNRATSALRVDVKRTSSHQTYITLTSIGEWAHKKFGISLFRLPQPMSETEMSTSQDAVPKNTELEAVEKKTSQEKGKPKQRRFDSLAAELDVILSKEPNLLPSQVMLKLRSRIGEPNTCVLENMGDGIKWENEKGVVKKLTRASLAQRITQWKSWLKQG